jgi:SEC-C motif-containing protein
MAETAEALIRARYTAYTLEKVEFLLHTMGPEVRVDLDPVEAARIAREADWLGLEIRSICGDQAGDTEAEIEYLAKFRLDGQLRIHHERAHLHRSEEGWMVHGGEVNPKDPPRRVEKVGRNDPCPCGSGKKFKKCCGA